MCAARPVASGWLWAGPRAIVLTLWTRVRTIRPDLGLPDSASSRAEGGVAWKQARSLPACGTALLLCLAHACIPSGRLCACRPRPVGLCGRPASPLPGSWLAHHDGQCAQEVTSSGHSGRRDHQSAPASQLRQGARVPSCPYRQRNGALMPGRICLLHM